MVCKHAARASALLGACARVCVRVCVVYVARVARVCVRLRARASHTCCWCLALTRVSDNRVGRLNACVCGGRAVAAGAAMVHGLWPAARVHITFMIHLCSGLVA